MNNKEILNSIKKSIDQAPIDILENIKEAPRVKMLKHDEITKQKVKTNPFKNFMPYVSIAAVFLIILFGWQYQLRTPDSYIYMDVNPSVKITTNRLNKVINLKADNLEGKLLTEDFDYKGMTINEVAEEILNRMVKEKYIDTDHKFLLLSIYNKNEEKSELQKVELNRKIHEYLEKKDLDPIVLSQKLDKTSTIENYAKEYGVSLSKITFIRNLITLNPELEIEDLVGLSIEELVILSQDMGLDLNKILDSTDFDKIKTLESDEEIEEKAEKESKIEAEITPEVQPEVKAPTKPKKPVKPVEPGKPMEENKDEDDEIVQKSTIISSSEAKRIALSIANGKITEFEFDDDDLEYEFEIELGEEEYEIKIDAKTGNVIKVEVDD